MDDSSPELSLLDVLKGVSHFNYHLSRGNTEQPLKNLIDVVLHRLMQSNPEQISEEAIYMPDGDTGMTLAFENTVFDTRLGGAPHSTFYGLSVRNHSGRHFFPYLAYFDPSDYSIQVRSWCSYGVTCFAYLVRNQLWYHPPAETMVAPLPPRHEHNEPSELKVGYGEANMEAFEFSLANGVTARRCGISEVVCVEDLC